MNQHTVDQAISEAFEQLEQEFSGLSYSAWIEAAKIRREAFISQKKAYLESAYGKEFQISYHRIFETFILWKKNKAFDGPGIEITKAMILPMDKIKP